MCPVQLAHYTIIITDIIGGEKILQAKALEKHFVEFISANTVKSL